MKTETTLWQDTESRVDSITHIPHFDSIADDPKMMSDFLTGENLLSAENPPGDGGDPWDSFIKIEKTEYYKEEDFSPGVYLVDEGDVDKAEDCSQNNYDCGYLSSPSYCSEAKGCYGTDPRNQLFHHKLVHGNVKQYSTNCASSLRRHIKGDNAAKKYNCNSCDSLVCIRHHEMTRVDSKYLDTLEHDDGEVDDPTSLESKQPRTNLKTMMCNECGFKAKTKNVLKSHIMTHSSVKRYKCSQCDYATNKTGNLNRHQTLHLNDAQYRCSQCPFQTKALVYFRRHQQSHASVKKFNCSHCTYGTNNICNLKRHQSKHIETKDLKCPECEYRTNCQSYLRRHILTHSDKKFKCSFCSYGTNNRSHLREHSRTHIL